MTDPGALRSVLEERVVDAVRGGKDELVALVSDLVTFDTTARNVGDPPRQEAELQEYLRERLETIEAETDVWEPEPTGSGSRFVPDDLDFEGRPQLAARLRGAGGGRSLLLNGHIDAVSAEPVGLWTSHPHRPEVRDGLLYGRGSCDMKGGMGGMLFALETMRRLDVRLAGDVVFCTDTDEESSGAGAYACAARGVKADAGLCAEPTGFDAWVACRGGVNPKVRTLGRAGQSVQLEPARSSASVSGGGYPVGRRHRAARVEVRLVGETVQISLAGRILRTHAARHDPDKIQGAFAIAKGRPRTYESAPKGGLVSVAAAE